MHTFAPHVHLCFIKSFFLRVWFVAGRILRSILFVNAVALSLSIQGITLRMLTCWPGSQLSTSTSDPVLSDDGFLLDPSSLVSAAAVLPGPRSGFGQSYVPTLFGGSRGCYTGSHLIHAALAVFVYLAHLMMSLCTILFSRRSHVSGAELHVGKRRGRPGSAVFVAWEVFYALVNVGASALLMSVLADFLPVLFVGFFSTLYVAAVGALFTFASVIRDRRYEIVVFSSVLALVTTTFIATMVALDSSQGSSDISATALIAPVVAVLAGWATSQARREWAMTHDADRLVWSSSVLHWVNTRTRCAAQAFLLATGRRKDMQVALSLAGSSQRMSMWATLWDSSTSLERSFSSSDIAACRSAIRFTVSSCRSAVQQLITRYPSSALPHLVAAEYFSSPVVSASPHDRLFHLAAAWRLGKSAPWHRFQVWHHLLSIQAVHCSTYQTALLSRQMQLSAEMGYLWTVASQVHAVRANVIQMCVAAASADVALLSSVVDGIQRVHLLCSSALDRLQMYKGDKVVFEQLLRSFVQKLSSDPAPADLAPVRAVRSVVAAATAAVFKAVQIPAQKTPIRKPSSSSKHQSPASHSDAPVSSLLARRNTTRRKLSLAASLRSLSYGSAPGLALQSPAAAARMSSLGFDTPSQARVMTSDVPSKRTTHGRSSAEAHRAAGGWLSCRAQAIVFNKVGFLSGNSQLPLVLRRLAQSAAAASRSQVPLIASANSQFGVKFGLPSALHTARGTGSHNSSSTSGATVQDLSPFHFFVDLHLSHNGSASDARAFPNSASTGFLRLLGLTEPIFSQKRLSDLFEGSQIASIMRRGTRSHLPTGIAPENHGEQLNGVMVNEHSWLEKITEGATLNLAVHSALQLQSPFDSEPSWAAGPDGTPLSAAASSVVAANVVAVPSWSTLASDSRQKDAGLHEVSAVSCFQEPRLRWLVLVEPLYSPDSTLAGLMPTTHDPMATAEDSEAERSSRSSENANLDSHGAIVMRPAQQHTQHEVQLARRGSGEAGDPPVSLSVAGPRSPGRSFGHGHMSPTARSPTSLPSTSTLGHRQTSLGVRTASAVDAKAQSTAQDRIRQQLQRGVKHNKYSRRVLLTIWANIIGVFLYTLYTVYLVLAAGNNPLIALRFRQPSMLSQLQVRPLTIQFWSTGSHLLSRAALAQAGPPLPSAAAQMQTTAASGIGRVLREVGEETAAFFAVSLSDASALDAAVPSVTDGLARQWRRQPDTPSSRDSSSLADFEAVIAGSLQTVTAGNASTSGARPLDDAFLISSAINSTSMTAVTILNSSFARTLQLRTLLAITLVICFVSATFFTAKKAESRLVQDAVDSLGAASLDAVSVTAQSGQQGELSPSMARRHIRKKRQKSVHSWWAVLGLKHELLLKVGGIVFFGVGLIGVGFVSRYTPEDTQATSVNVVHAAHQLQSAAIRMGLATDAYLSAAHNSTPAVPAALGLASSTFETAQADFVHWQRVLFGEEDAGYMQSASPGNEARALFATGTGGHNLLFHDACLSVDAHPKLQPNPRYLPFAGTQLITARRHASNCQVAVNGVLLKGFQAASYTYLSISQELRSTLEAWQEGGMPLSCLQSARYSIWLVLGHGLGCISSIASERSDCAVTPDVALGAVLAELGNVCAAHGATPAQLRQAASFTRQAIMMQELQAVHFAAIADAAIVFGADRYSASQARYARETLLPVGSVPFVLLLFLIVVGRPSALAKRRLVLSSQLMQALIGAMAAGIPDTKAKRMLSGGRQDRRGSFSN